MRCLLSRVPCACAADPYPSNYLVYQQTRDPAVTLPAWPMRAACAAYEGAAGAATPAAELLARMAKAVECVAGDLLFVEEGIIANEDDLTCTSVPMYWLCLN